MDKEKLVDLQRFRSPKIGPKIWVRMIVYVAILSVLLIYFNQKSQQQTEAQDGTYVEEVRGVTIESE